MKNNIEQKIKESLQNHEMPYNASAWTAMQAKLDVVKPVSVAAPASNLKWIIVAASVAVIGVVGYIAVNSTTEPTKKEQTQAQTNEINSSDLSSDANVENKNLASNTNATPSNNTSNNSNSNNSTVTNSSVTNDKSVNNSNESTNNVANSNNTSNKTSDLNTATNSNNTNNSNANNNSTNTTKNYVLPKVSDACDGEVVTVKNTNDVPMLIEGADLHFIIPANSERKVRMSGSGNHTISLMTDDSKKSSSFYVKNTPNADFLIDTDTKFEKGLPTTKLEATTNGVDYTWIIGKTRVHGEKVNAHFYTADSHNITLIVKDQNGCTSSTSKSVQIDEKYNLMAVNSFIPDDVDNRNNTFMPFALTQRDVKFNLIILDPADGHIVFQSKDASNAWNGIDKTTGNPVNYGTTYIWKVTIENAEPNENNEYVGNITPIRKR